ncbi:carboxypeptidase regulatory-like domain-containing protein [Mucilaginibacter terrae]|uniref:TonB-dependent receptor n=1 Tax=Mucilaginibacter terrae TaxID=1955052 RepID=UPI00363FB5AC
MKKNLLLALLFLFTTAVTFAQVTTSSLTGTVKDSKENLIGATVKATFVPSGTVYATSTRADGRYTIQNMRPGGPYLIEITYLGYEAQKATDVYLKLGEPFVINATLLQSGTALNAVTVTGNTRSVLNSDRSGSVTNLSTRDINTLPTINRTINDITRLTPQSNGSSIGGGNFRQNNITIDGGNFNNAFGIGTNLPGNGNPIPLDALDEISVSVNPVDVRQNNVIGAAINANTRSGTNEFSGSAYTYYRDENYLGTKVRNYAELVPAAQKSNTYGFRLGGPIIKNKLFFFANVESEKQQRAGSTVFASTPENPFPSSPNVRRPSRAELDDISNYLRTTYGYETGAYDGYNFDSERLNIVGRLDWNINDKNRFNVRYSQLESKTPSFVSTSTSPLVAPVYPVTGNRGDNNALAFQNSNYFTDYNFYSLSAELNSSLFASKFANTLRFTYNKQNEPRSSESAIFPFVDILRDGRPFTSFGYEPFTFGNLRDVKSTSVVDYVQWTEGRHNLLAGAQAEFTSVINGFQRFGTSYYIFNSFDDFKNGAQPLSYSKTYSLNPDFSQAFPTFKNAQYSIYAQDDYNVTDKLRLTFGGRLNYYTYKQDLLTHPLIAALQFKNGETINTGALPKKALLFSPRFGFNYDVKGDRTFQIRGSASIVSGGIPNVWIISQVGDAGLVQFTQIEQNISATLPTTSPLSRVFNPDPNFYLPATPPAAGTSIPSAISIISPDIKAPQTFKANLAADFRLPYGFTGTLEGLYNRDFRTVLFRNPNLVDPTPLNVSGYPDNRLFYPNATADKFINRLDASGKAYTSASTGTQQPFNTYVLDNASKGYYWSILGKLEKQLSKGLSASIAYIRSEAKTLFDGNGDQPSGSWQGTTSVNGSNNPEMGYSSFVLPNRVVGNITYRKEYLKKLGTTISLFYEGQNNGRISYTYSTDFNRDGAQADLIYVPKDPSEITFVPFTTTVNGVTTTYSAQQQSDLFFRFIEQDSYLLSRKGKYAERAGGVAPWVNLFDIKILQDVFTNIGKKRNTLQFELTVQNFGNLLNKNWGIQRSVVQSSILAPVNATSLVPGSATRPTFNLRFDGLTPTNTTFFRDNVSFNSTYSMQIGLRYLFN